MAHFLAHRLPLLHRRSATTSWNVNKLQAGACIGLSAIASLSLIAWTIAAFV